MALDIRLPFFYGAAVAILAIVLVFATWSYPAVQKIVGGGTTRGPREARQAARS
jgi:hypothetical protein